MENHDMNIVKTFKSNILPSAKLLNEYENNHQELSQNVSTSSDTHDQDSSMVNLIARITKSVMSHVNNDVFINKTQTFTENNDSNDGFPQGIPKEQNPKTHSLTFLEKLLSEYESSTQSHSLIGYQ